MQKEKQLKSNYNAPLYSAFARATSTAMTNGADRFSRSVIPQGFYAGYSERNVKAFTLIELLVVVLIIGILAAVALPQYQKAVWKSRNTQLKTLVSAIGQAQEIYKMANSTYSDRFDELNIEIPLPINNQAAAGYFHTSHTDDCVRQGKDFIVAITQSNAIFGLWIDGPYQGTGFRYANSELQCIEKTSADKVNQFCTKLEHAVLDEQTTSQSTTWKYYHLP